MAEAPVMADKSAKLRTPQLATAALLVKGALYEKYKTAITVGYKYEAKTKGRIIVAYAGAKPADADLKGLEDRVNKIIAEGRAVEVTEQERKAAEAHFTKNPVNGQYIYEKKEPPASVTSLTIVTIVDWTVIASASKDFVASTKQVGSVKLARFNHRENKQELEVAFEISDAPVTEKPADAKTKEAPKASAAPTPTHTDNVSDASTALFAAFFDALNKTRPELQLSQTDIDQIKRNANLKTNVILTALKNSSYASGYAARLGSK